MSFPQTRHTLIERIAQSGEERDWEQFLADYWGPICRFARRRGAPTWQDAEDAASQTFAALLQNHLLARWVITRTARLRTLLCTVVRNILANRARVEIGRARLREQGRIALPTALDATAEQEDAFYAAWVEDLVCRAVDLLLRQLHEESRGDHFRILHGRICEDMSLAEIARSLNLAIGQTESAYKQARQRLTQILEDLLRMHVSRYSTSEEAAAEFSAEWSRLGQHLHAHGELEASVRQTFEAGVPPRPSGWQALRTRFKAEAEASDGVAGGKQ